MRRTENKQRRRQNDLMVIERARGPTATPNSEQGEHKSTLLIHFFPPQLITFSFLRLHLRWGSYGGSENNREPASCLLRDKERIHSHSNSCANEVRWWALRLLAARRLVCRFGRAHLLHRIPQSESSTLDHHFIFYDWGPGLGQEKILKQCNESQ